MRALRRWLSWPRRNLRAYALTQAAVTGEEVIDALAAHVSPDAVATARARAKRKRDTADRLRRWAA